MLREVPGAYQISREPEGALSLTSELRTKRQIRDHLLWLLLEVSGLVSVDKNLALASMCGTTERREGKREGRLEGTRRGRTVSCSSRSDCAYLRTHQ